MAANDEITQGFPASINVSSVCLSNPLSFLAAAKIGRQPEKILNNKKVVFKQALRFKVSKCHPARMISPFNRL